MSRGLAEAVLAGTLDFAALPVEDEAIVLLSSLKGIGRWSAEIYLLFAEGAGRHLAGGRSGRADRDWRKQLLGLEDRPSEADAVTGQAWRPHRGAAAIFCLASL